MKALLGVDALRPAQMKELEDAMAASPWTGIPKPERLLRSQQGRIEPVAAEPTAEAAESQAPADAVHADGYDDMEPVEFNGRINEETFAVPVYRGIHAFLQSLFFPDVGIRQVEGPRRRP